MASRFGGRSEIRREDLPHYKIIEKNRPVIRGLINNLTGGSTSQSQKTQEPEASTKTFHIGGATKANEPGRPVVSISMNGRVLIIDDARAKQLMHIGNLVAASGITTFKVATKENGFFSPVDSAISDVLIDLDGRNLANDFTEEDLAREITTRLSLEEDAN